MRAQVLTAATVKIAAFWDIAPCRFVDRRFRGTYYIHGKGDEVLMMEAVCTSETSIYFSETTRCYISVSYNAQDL
jgi:hypothetical protein